jgi:hypothetical protein
MASGVDNTVVLRHDGKCYTVLMLKNNVLRHMGRGSVKKKGLRVVVLHHHACRWVYSPTASGSLLVLFLGR